MTKRKNRSELDFQLRARKVDRFAAVAETLIKFGTFCVVAYFFTGALKAYAGEVTFAQVGITLLGDLKVNEWVAYLLAGGAVTYGLRQRKLRRDKTEELAGRLKQLEGRFDPRRSSSRLTPRGTTHPEDSRR